MGIPDRCRGGCGGFWLYQQLSEAGVREDTRSQPWAGPEEIGGGSLVRPAPSEIHGRPAEPLPGGPPAAPAEGGSPGETARP